MPTITNAASPASTPLINFHIITIFPEMFAALQHGITGRAAKNNLISVNCINLRQYSDNRYGSIDDRPYGGGPGMVMMAEPLLAAINGAKHACHIPAPTPAPAHVMYLSPQGKPLTQKAIEELSIKPNLIMIAGRYEGIDERVIESAVDSEWSIGDYVLSGGELAAMVVIDAITRLLPGALGDADSALQESFTSGLLDYPHYTRPETINQLSVPKVLLGGNHHDITRWRLKQALGRTWLRRPELLQKLKLTKDEIMLLNEFLRFSMSAEADIEI